MRRPDGTYGRPKMDPATRAARLAIGRRLKALAEARHGKGGGAAMAAELGVSQSTWSHWCARGQAMPPEVLLRLVVRTGVAPLWLLHGSGPMIRAAERPRPTLPRFG